MKLTPEDTMIMSQLPRRTREAYIDMALIEETETHAVGWLVADTTGPGAFSPSQARFYVHRIGEAILEDPRSVY